MSGDAYRDYRIRAEKTVCTVTVSLREKEDVSTFTQQHSPTHSLTHSLT